MKFALWFSRNMVAILGATVLFGLVTSVVAAALVGLAFPVGLVGTWVACFGFWWLWKDERRKRNGQSLRMSGKLGVSVEGQTLRRDGDRVVGQVTGMSFAKACRGDDRGNRAPTPEELRAWLSSMEPPRHWMAPPKHWTIVVEGMLDDGQGSIHFDAAFIVEHTDVGVDGDLERAVHKAVLCTGTQWAPGLLKVHVWNGDQLGPPAQMLRRSYSNFSVHL